MKKLFTFLCLALLVPAAWAKQVPQHDAQQFAVNFYKLNNHSGITNPQVKSTTVKSIDNLPTLYIFRFISGGFVLIAADDASIPILGYSFENDMPENIDHPAVKEWLESYSRQIAYIVSHNIDNKETLKQWNSDQNKKPMAPSLEVLPFTTTLWDQGCYYNSWCPSDAAGLCGHAVTGCVATAMAQILKYYNFPPQGVGQHSYTAPNYGQQSINFGNTFYDWASMPDSAISNNDALATLMYHAGVSVEMNYGANSSGAYAFLVPIALRDYFNYSPDIDMIFKSNYTNVEDFKALLRTDLDSHLPICYGGDGSGGGHEFVCDGYRMSDSTFHFNWGWSGIANGYYTIGNLNPSGYSFDNNNDAVIHIKPYNPDLIVRITNPADKMVASVGDNVEIKASVVRGSATLMKIFIDDVEKCSATVDSISFIWNISISDLGSHVVKAYAYNATDTVYYKEQLNVSEWISQASGFTTPLRAVNYISAVDSNVVWASAGASATNLWGACSDFTRTTDGGTTWRPGVITNTTGLGSAMIFGIDSLTAYVAMYKASGNKPMGIYMTSDGGTTWTHQASASFSNASSFPDVVHFFNANDGVTIGDPVSGKFEIYTTSNGGSNWTLIAGSGNPDPVSGEIGTVGYYCAIHDTIWFGTTRGRVYKSVNKGVTWIVSAASAMSGKQVKPMFCNGSHGLLIEDGSGAGLLCESFDGGYTWTQVNFTGPNEGGDIAYVPGTPNTWVKSGYFVGTLGCSYSFDGGHTWTDFIGATGAKYFQLVWVNNHCGWSGGINASPTENGVYKFIGLLQAPLPTPLNVHAMANNQNVDITWNEPAYDHSLMALQGYNISRDGSIINSSLITDLTFIDQNVPNNQYTYCVSAQYNIGASTGNCSNVNVAVGIKQQGEQPLLLIYPNPAHGRVMIKTSGNNREISIFDLMGNAMKITVKNLSTDLSSIDISGLSAGTYLVELKTSEGISRTKLIVY